MLTVGVWVLWVLSKEGAWCHRWGTALQAGALHSSSNFPSNQLGDLEKISSLLLVSPVKLRIWREWFFSALCSPRIWRKNALDMSETKGRTFYLSCLWRWRNRPDFLPLLFLKEFLLYFFRYHLVPSTATPTITTLLSMSMSPFSFLLNPSAP